MDDQTHQAQQHERRRLGDRCPATGASEIAKPVFPKNVVGLVDRTIVIAIGTQVHLRAERIAPEGVIGCVDNTVAVVIAVARRRRLGNGDLEF